MKNKTQLLLTLLLVLLAPMALFGQTATYSTITSAALTATQLCFQVAATTNMSASGALTGPNGTPQEWDLWTDGEWMKINTVNTTSNQVCVQRGKSPTRAGAHATAMTVFFGPAGASPFITSAPTATSAGVVDVNGQFGTCTSTAYTFLPLIQVTTGAIWNCPTAATQGVSHWNVYGFREWTMGHPMVRITDAAYTLSLADEFVYMSSHTATRIVTLPAITGIIGKTVVIGINAVSTSTITVTPVNGQTIGPAAATTFALTGAGNVIRLISVANQTSGSFGWVTW